MQEQMRQHADPQARQTETMKQKTRGGNKVGDYIDFEEVKD